MKKITLAIAAIAAAFTMNAQSDCANSESISVSVDASTTISAGPLSGTTPSTTCNPNFYDNTAIQNAGWYSYTAPQDLIVTVFSPVPADTSTDYVPSFSIYSGSCGDLTCIGGSLITVNQQQQPQPAEDSFFAENGETYYIVFDDFYSQVPAPNGPIGTNSAFTFDIITDSNVPALPGVATNPMPTDGATDVTIGTTTSGGTSVDVSWDAPSTGGSATSYIIRMSPEQDFSSGTISGTFTNTQIDGLNVPSQPNYFTPNTTYYWQVIPQNARGGADEDANNTVETWSFTTEGTASVNDVTANTFNHYLNNNVLTVESNSSIENVTIFNILGQQVATQKVAAQDAQVNVGSFKPGVYLAQVKVEGKVKTFKFVKK